MTGAGGGGCPWGHAHHCYSVGGVVHQHATEIIDRCRSDDQLLGGKHDGLVPACFILQWKWRVVPLRNRTAALSPMGVAVPASCTLAITRKQLHEGINTKCHVSCRHEFVIAYSTLEKVTHLQYGTECSEIILKTSWNLSIKMWQTRCVSDSAVMFYLIRFL